MHVCKNKCLASNAFFVKKCDATNAFLQEKMKVTHFCKEKSVDSKAFL